MKESPETRKSLANALSSKYIQRLKNIMHGAGPIWLFHVSPRHITCQCDECNVFKL